MKTCSQCGVDQALSMFPLRKNRRGDLAPVGKCRPCRNATVKAWQQQNQDKVREYGQTSRQKHAERISARKKGWLARTVSQRTAQGLAWRKDNPDKAREIERRYKLQHPEKIAAKRARRFARYPERMREQATERQNRRRARKKAAYIAPVNRRAIYERDGGICQLCFLPVDWADLEIDHIIPLARGGTHEPKNVQAAHEVCNRKKGASLVCSWLDALSSQPPMELLTPAAQAPRVAALAAPGQTP